MAHAPSLEYFEHRVAALDRAQAWGWEIASFAHDCPEPHGERCPVEQPAGLDSPAVVDPWDYLPIGPLA